MTAMRTFVRDDGRYPARRDDWERIAAFARQLLEQREERYPALVDAGRLDAGEADRALRVLRAAVQQWRRVVQHEPLPHPVDYADELGADVVEIAAELRLIADRLAGRDAAAPFDPAARERTELSAALAWHQEPVAPGSAPHIWIAHGYALWDWRRAHPPVEAAA